MELFHVVIKSHDDEEHLEYVTSEPVSHGIAVGVDRGLVNLDEENYYTEIIKADET